MRTRKWARTALLLLLGVILPWYSVSAGQSDGTFFGLDLHGSLGKGGHSRYVAPLTNPLFNESPYITTEIRPIYFHQKIPSGFVTQGGDIDVVALQLRLALTERLAFIATKDGYANINFDKTLPDEDGFANIALGFKYAIFSQPEKERILTAGLRYEIPIGDLDTAGIELQGDGDGFLNPFITGATTFGNLGVQGSVGGNFALDRDKDTSILHYSLHLDYEVLPNLFPLVELNGFTPLDHGNRLTGPLGNLDGIDMVNFGSNKRGTTVTLGGGLRYRLFDQVQLGVGAETPVITDNKDDTLMGWRTYVDLVIAFVK